MTASIRVDSGGRLRGRRRGAGDVESTHAFDRLYADYASQVRHVVRRYLSDAMVEDVVQEAFIQAYRSGLHLDRETEGDLATWKRLAGIARHRTFDVLRRRMRRIEEVPGELALDTAPTMRAADEPERQLQASGRREGIAEAFDSLCERQRRVLFLRDIDGLRYSEIAELEGITIEAVKSTLARGRRSFREAYMTIAERRGLNVVLGGGVLAQLRLRLRQLRDRAGNVAQHAGGLATASPVIAQAFVAAVVVGAIAVAGLTGPPDRPVASQVVYHTEGEPADEPAPHDDTFLTQLAHAAASREITVDAEVDADPGGTPAIQPVPDVPAPGPVSQSTDNGVDTDDIVPVGGVPAQAAAAAKTATGADPQNGNAHHSQEVNTYGATDGLEDSHVVVGQTRVGCGAGTGGPVTGTACPALKDAVQSL